MSIKNNMNDIIKDTPELEETPIQIYNSWDELDIEANLLRGIYAYGFEKPSPIQSKAIYPIKEGKDVIAQAQSGTGKTAAFTVGALSRITISDRSNQVLIIAPTHELAQQISTVITGLSELMTGIIIKTIIGGISE